MNTGTMSSDYSLSPLEMLIPYDSIHMWNLRHETDEHRGGKKQERGKP